MRQRTHLWSSENRPSQKRHVASLSFGPIRPILKSISIDIVSRNKRFGFCVESSFCFLDVFLVGFGGVTFFVLGWFLKCRKSCLHGDEVLTWDLDCMAFSCDLMLSSLGQEWVQSRLEIHGIQSQLIEIFEYLNLVHLLAPLRRFYLT